MRSASARASSALRGGPQRYELSDVPAETIQQQTAERRTVP